MSIYEFHRGTAPLLISIPHAGTEVPPEILQRLTPGARELPDTDWYVHQLYAFARDLGASVIKANVSRYVVDLNRAADSAPLYPSGPNSPVCPTTTFAGAPLYQNGSVPDDEETGARVEKYWQPYHRCIAEELVRIKAGHRHALLWDAHSIASEIPGLFDGKLPEFNFGTRGDASCPREIAESLLRTVQAGGQFSAVLNGRFKGGYITKGYGNPAAGIYAIQLELSQRTYMRETPKGPWEPAQAQDAARCIEQLLRQYLSFAN